MSLLRRIEKSLDQRLRSVFGGGSQQPGGREAIELYRDALDQISARAAVGKRGDRIFPFNLITIELNAPDEERKSALSALFDPAQMVEDVRATLTEERVSLPHDLAIAVTYPDGALTDLRVVCSRREKPAVAPAASNGEPLRARLITLSGVTSQADFAVLASRVNIGREREVVDSLGRAVRKNDLFFPEGADEVNGSVSRSHAHFEFDRSAREWRVYDDGSSLGTSIFRDGHRIEVPGHASRGVALKAGDEIYLGQARLRFEFA